MEIRERLSEVSTRIHPEYALAMGGAILALAFGTVKALDGPDRVKAAESPYCAVSNPAKPGEGIDDLILDVYPYANRLPEGVVEVDQLGKDDLILGEGEQAEICVPDNASFRTARGLDTN